MSAPLEHNPTGIVAAAHSLAAGHTDEADPQYAVTQSRAAEIVDVVVGLGGDPELQAAAYLYPFLESGLLSTSKLASNLPEQVTKLAGELVKLGKFTFPENWDVSSGLDEQQGETLRKMLLSIIEDVRLVLVLLANQLHRLRSVKNAPEQERRRVAMETREIYAPLANKLGVWQLKWELEDLAFRFLEPQTYQQIAKLLAEKRNSREQYIDEVIAVLQDEIARLGIKADIQGRPKHIFSIYKKMQRKGVSFDHIFDVRAIRVLVDTVAECYAVLGAVHGRWPYIRGEFDDYIATPKENFYRSLHTAVIGPGNKTVEIQIRTHEMHAHAELGVAAHWKYKEGGGADAAFERKIRWVRSLLDPGETDTDGDDLIARFRADLFEDRVYVLTPKGQILDLPAGSTPLDFAYYVHTELGHRCRGAKIDGRIVPLTHKLENGVQVEIITAKSGEPSRDWLIPQLGYLASTRARGKVRAWFRRQDQQKNLEQGRQLLERELSRLGHSQQRHDELAQDFSLSGPTDLYIALGTGDITLADLARRLQQRNKPRAEPEGELLLRKPSRPTQGDAIDIEGVGGLMTSLARCCKPVPPDPIAGYITVGRGVTIHRQYCANFLRLADRYSERVLEVNWAGAAASTYPVDISIEAYDRRGLVKDISSLLSSEKVNIVGMTTTTDKTHMTATFALTIEIRSLEELSKLMLRIGNLPNVVSVTRRS